MSTFRVITTHASPRASLSLSMRCAVESTAAVEPPIVARHARVSDGANSQDERDCGDAVQEMDKREIDGREVPRPPTHGGVRVVFEHVGRGLLHCGMC